jgi:hypothetical protein
MTRYAFLARMGHIDQDAFDHSPVGRSAGAWIAVNHFGGKADIKPDFVLSLAAAYAFGARLPAFDAGRKLAVWGEG